MPLVRWRATRLALALGLVLLASTAADATQITLYSAGTPGLGFAPEDVAAAEAAGARAPLVLEGLVVGDGLTLTRTELSIDARGGSRRRPARGRETWLLEVSPEVPADLRGGARLVILGHDPTDPARYKSRKVGLEVDTTSPWQLVSEGPGGPVYLGYTLGSLIPGARYEVPIEFRVSQRLKRRGGAFAPPRYAVAYAALPESTAGAFALVGLGAAWLVRRRR